MEDLIQELYDLSDRIGELKDEPIWDIVKSIGNFENEVYEIARRLDKESK